MSYLSGLIAKMRPTKMEGTHWHWFHTWGCKLKILNVDGQSLTYSVDGILDVIVCPHHKVNILFQGEKKCILQLARYHPKPHLNFQYSRNLLRYGYLVWNESNTSIFSILEMY